MGRKSIFGTFKAFLVSLRDSCSRSHLVLDLSQKATLSHLQQGANPSQKVLIMLKYTFCSAVYHVALLYTAFCHPFVVCSAKLCKSAGYAMQVGWGGCTAREFGR